MFKAGTKITYIEREPITAISNGWGSHTVNSPKITLELTPHMSYFAQLTLVSKN
jgi:hypothetical protein